MIASGRAALASGGDDLGIGIGHGEDDRLLRHLLDHFGLERAGGGKAEEDVGALQRLLQRARVGVGGMGGLPLVHALSRPW